MLSKAYKGLTVWPQKTLQLMVARDGFAALDNTGNKFNKISKQKGNF